MHQKEACNEQIAWHLKASYPKREERMKIR